ncbi:hypothetical protein HD553DRAFT_327224, partial [Filobasidium floriforme]|uniref:uncharacterized protein n=1 Tax=Filobasidium floriforme TaxID=5210 RepID=UPI001E8D1322
MEGPQQDFEQDVDVPMEEDVLAVRTPTPGRAGHDDGGVMDEMELAGEDAVSEAEEEAAPAISPERKAAWLKKSRKMADQRRRSRRPESPSPLGTRPIAPLGSATSPRARREARQGSDDPDQREAGQIWAGYWGTRSQRRARMEEEEDELESVQASSDWARPTPTKRIRRVPARNPLSPTKQGTRAGPDNNTQAGPGPQTRANRAATSAASSPAKSPRRKPKPATSSPAATPTKGKGRATSTKGGRGQAKAEIKPEVKQEPSAGTLLNHAKAKRRQEDPGAVEFLGDERCDTCRSLGASKGGDEPWWGCWRNPNSKKERSCSHCVAVRAKCSFNDEPRHVDPPAAGPSTTGLSQEWVNGLAARLDRAIGGMEVGLGVLNSMAATALGEPANNMLAERIQEFSAVSADLRRGPSGSTAAAAIEVEADDEDEEDEEEEEEEEEEKEEDEQSRILRKIFIIVSETLVGVVGVRYHRRILPQGNTDGNTNGFASLHPNVTDHCLSLGTPRPNPRLTRAVLLPGTMNFAWDDQGATIQAATYEYNILERPSTFDNILERPSTFDNTLERLPSVPMSTSAYTLNVRQHPRTTRPSSSDHPHPQRPNPTPDSILGPPSSPARFPLPLSDGPLRPLQMLFCEKESPIQLSHGFHRPSADWRANWGGRLTIAAAPWAAQWQAQDEGDPPEVWAIVVGDSLVPLQGEREEELDVRPAGEERPGQRQARLGRYRIIDISFWVVQIARPEPITDVTATSLIKTLQQCLHISQGGFYGTSSTPQRLWSGGICRYRPTCLSRVLDFGSHGTFLRLRNCPARGVLNTPLRRGGGSGRGAIPDSPLALLNRTWQTIWTAMFGSSDLTDDLTDRSVIWSVSCALDSLPVLGG